MKAACSRLHCLSSRDQDALGANQKGYMQDFLWNLVIICFSVILIYIKEIIRDD